MSGATRTLYLDDEFLRRTVGNVRRLNSLPGQLPGAFFFDRRPAAVPAAGLLLEINIGERLAAVVSRQSTLPTLRLTTAAGRNPPRDYAAFSRGHSSVMPMIRAMATET